VSGWLCATRPFFARYQPYGARTAARPASRSGAAAVSGPEDSVGTLRLPRSVGCARACPLCVVTFVRGAPTARSGLGETDVLEMQVV
jgi:hypothetical protein